MKALSNIFLWTHRTAPWCNMLQTLERRIKYILVSFCQTNPLSREPNTSSFGKKINELINPPSISLEAAIRCSMKKGVLGNFAKFTGTHLCQSLFFNKVEDLRPATLLKKTTLAQVYSCEFCEISKNAFFREHFWASAFISQTQRHNQILQRKGKTKKVSFISHQ